MNFVQTHFRIFFYLLAAFGAHTLSSLNAAQVLDDLRSLTQEWIALEESIAKEAIAWEDKQSQLNDFIKIAKIEVDHLQENLEQLDAVATTADERRATLLAEQAQYAEYTAIVTSFLKKTETALSDLKSKLPNPLQEALTPFYLRLPQNADETSLGIAERMQTVVGILSKIQQFDSLITVSQEIKKLPDGSQGEVTTLYLGLGAGYYITTAGNDAGYGHPGEAGWSWKSQPELMDSIAEAIAIAENTASQATFISLPVTLKN